MHVVTIHFSFCMFSVIATKTSVIKNDESFRLAQLMKFNASSNNENDWPGLAILSYKFMMSVWEKNQGQLYVIKETSLYFSNKIYGILVR